VAVRPVGAPGGADVPSGVQPWLRVVRATASGLLVAAATFLLVGSGLLPRPATLLLVLLLAAAVPVAPGLAARVAVNLSLLVGWAPVLWWVDWPGSPNHGAVLAALTAGGVAAYVLAGPAPRTRLRTLVPATRAADLLIPLAAVAGVVATLPLAAASTPRRALEVLVPGADNWAHYAMFANLRAYGATTDLLGAAPDGSPWAFESYPKAFHALAATVSEVLAPSAVTGAETLEVYAHTLSAVVVLVLVMVTAAVLALPRLADRAWLALPAVVLTWTGLLWEPGQKVLANGFAGFWVAAVAGATALLLGLAAPAVRTTVLAAAVGGLLVTVSHTWVPLVVVAAPAALLVLAHRRGGGRRRVLTTLVVLAVSAGAATYALVITLRTVTVGFVVAEVSGFDGTSPIPTFVLLLVLGYAVLRARVWAGEGRGLPDGTVLRLRLLGLAPLLGLLALSGLLVLQVRAIGTTSYYFLKYFLGYELILTCVTPAVVAMLLAAALPELRAHRAWSAGVLAAVLGTQLFVPGWQTKVLLFSTTDDGTAAVKAPYSRSALAKGVLEAVGSSSTPGDSFRREYLPLGPGNAVQTFYPGAWYHAVNASVSGDVWARLAVLRTRADSVDAAVPLVRRLLERDTRVEVMVAPSYVDPLRAALPAGVASRVVPVGIRP
jgi:hypothetical protein